METFDLEEKKKKELRRITVTVGKMNIDKIFILKHAKDEGIPPRTYY